MAGTYNRQPQTLKKAHMPNIPPPPASHPMAEAGNNPFSAPCVFFLHSSPPNRDDEAWQNTVSSDLIYTCKNHPKIGYLMINVGYQILIMYMPKVTMTPSSLSFMCHLQRQAHRRPTYYTCSSSDPERKGSGAKGSSSCVTPPEFSNINDGYYYRLKS